MSTMVMRAVLKAVREGKKPSETALEAAEVEVESIERAAKDYASDEEARLSPEAHDVMESIARDAP